MSPEETVSLIRETVIEMFRDGTLSLEHSEDGEVDFYRCYEEHTLSIELNLDDSPPETLSEITFSFDIAND